ncbi:hypothetical protein [Zestomonas insulae]|nr:hypothetical protein [Pseudomonas insulae]
MEKLVNKNGRPRSPNPRTIVSEVYLTPEEADELKAAGKQFGYPYLSQFLRNVAFAHIHQRSVGADAASAIVLTYLGSLASDIDVLNELCSRPGMPDAAFVISDSVKRRIRELSETIQKQQQ